MEILIVEDEAQIARFLSLELEHEGYKTTCISDGREALDEALARNYNLIVLDVMLPSLNGVEVLRRLRAVKDTPVIILSARDQVMDKVAGLDLGANDYMTKPFSIEELLARIRSILKQNTSGTTTAGEKNEIIFKNLKIDVDAQKVSFLGEHIELTKKEFDLLVYMLKNKNVVLNREKILDTVWGYDFYGNTNVVDVYIRYIRSKIDDRFNTNIIDTVRGSGYIIRE